MLEDYQSSSICLHLSLSRTNITSQCFSSQGRKGGKMLTQSVGNAIAYGHHWMDCTETKLPILLVERAGRSQL